MKNFLIWLWQEDDQWVSVCYNPLISSCGDTKASAQENLEEAIKLYFSDEEDLSFPVFENAESHKISIAI